MKSCLLLMPRIGPEQIISEDVRRVGVGIPDRKARTAGTVDVLGPGFSAKFVISVGFHENELNDSCLRCVSAVEGHGKRSCPAVELICVEGQSSMRIRLVPPVKSAVQQGFFKPPVYDQVFARR